MFNRMNWLVAASLVILSNSLQAVPLGSAFTYQGKLEQNGVDVTNPCDFNFGLWDAAEGGSQVAAAIDVANLQVTEGTFTVELDYGAGVFDGQARWLEIAVACPTGGGLTTLAPRQELTPSPNALFAAEAGAMEWTSLLNIPPDIADGDDVDDDDADASNELQDLSLAGNSLSLTGDATPVDLSGYLDNTDDQSLAEVLTEGNDAGGITITNLPAPLADSDASTKAYVDSQGGAQDLTDVLTQGNDAGGITITNLPAPIAASDAATRTYVDGHVDADFDPTNELQDLDLSGNTLSLTGDASPVNLSGFLDNTDDQILDLTADQLSIEGGNSVDLSGYLDNTDDQTLAEVLAEGNDAGGTSISNIGTTTTTALTISGLDCTSNTNGGALTTNASGVVSCSDDNGGAGMGNTLDEAYDQGGAGAGRTITADSGAVTIEGIDGLELDAANLFQTPADPVLVGSLGIGANPTSVHVSGRFAFVIDNASDDLKVIDVMNPNTPSQVGSLGIGPNPSSLFVSGRYAYVVDQGSDDLKIIDVSNSSAPSLVSSLSIGTFPGAVHVSGRYAYVVDGDSQDLKVIDISDPSAPSIVGSLVHGGQLSPTSLFVSGRYAFVIDVFLQSMLIYDVSNPNAPSDVGGFFFGFDSGPRSVYVSGRYAYAVDGSDLKVINVSDPSMPSLIGTLSAGLSLRSIFASGNYVYMTDEGSDELLVAEVSNPGLPVVAGSLSIGSLPHSIFVVGRTAYVVDRDSNDLKVIDISGAEFSSAIAHSLEAGNLQVRNDIIAQGQLQVTGGVNVGSGGIFSAGDVGVAGNITAVSAETGIFGQTDATVGATTGAGFAGNQVAGIYGASSVDTTTEVIHGVVGETRSTVGGGVYATNLSSDPSNSPDLVLGISDYGGGGDNGIISSEPSDGNSDIFLHSMDTVVVRLNQDGDSNGSESPNSRFEVSYTPSGGSANRIFYIDSSGDVFADGGYHCGNSIDDLAGTLSESEIAPCLLDDSPADFAEMLPAAGESQPGDVLVTAPDGTLTQSWSAYSGNVVGVYSSRPSYLGNARKLDADDHVPLAVSGIVPVKVSAENGPIQAGDLLTSAAIPGHAMRCEGVERCFGRVIGKALEPLSTDTGVIRILVSLN